MGTGRRDEMGFQGMFENVKDIADQAFFGFGLDFFYEIKEENV